MILTEEEAKTKECRQMFAAFVPTATQGSIALHAQQQVSVGFGTCAGRRCMGWRWWSAAGADKPTGYCGFAGPPASGPA